ncbi:MAG: helix-hairpin-helix domain-containing protein [Chloroflexota bacterium]|nr:helix-hairpin-helix domain-containing protein [Chloroflexota bacterium]
MAEQKMNLNSVTVEELTRLPGIGPALAERIVRYRETVHAFEEPAEITAVPGIGESTYGAIADRLTVSSAETIVPTPIEASREEPGDGEGMPGGSETEESPKSEGRAVPPGESLPEEGLDLEDLVPEGGLERSRGERWTEDAGPSADGIEEDESKARRVSDEGETAVEERPTQEPSSAERGPRPASPSTAAEPAAPSFWGQLSWLWTAILGGFLGLFFALVVFAGVNGSLDVARSRAVLSMEGRIDGLVADVDSLQGDVDGLRKRLDALEGLTARMEQVESAVDDLWEETADLGERAKTLEEDVAAVSEELQAVSDDVAALQEQAEQTRSFFLRLRSMLNDIFGEVEERSTPPGSESK